MVYTTPTKKARVVSMRRDGNSFPVIANRLGIDRSTASRIYAKYSKNEDFYTVGSKSGRPRKLDDYDRRIAARMIRSGKARDGADLRRQQFPDVSYSTIRKELREMGLHGRRRRKKFFLRDIHVKKRRIFARDYSEWTAEEWKPVVFSDESKFNLFGLDGVLYCRRGVGEEFKPQNVAPRVKHGGGSIMVWGCITSKGVGRLHRIKGNLTGEYYTRILEENLLGTLSDHGLDRESVIFQQDNDPKHTSRVAKAWFAENHIRILPWPPNSPDMNIIEHIWAYIEIIVQRHNPPPRNKDELWEILQKAWAELDMGYLRELYESMPRRVAALSKAKGQYTKY